jgi:polyphosphate glucokinase
MIVLGVDVGGSSIKAAPVDVEIGELVAEQVSVPTPRPSTPEAFVQSLRQLYDTFALDCPIGVAFPTVLKHGTVVTAANIDKRVIGVNMQFLTEQALGRPAQFINDADAAGIAEMSFGAGVGRQGTVLLLTFGTGIGSALFLDGKLLPNTEFGHAEVDGVEAEKYASARVRTQLNLDWPAWTTRVNRLLAMYHMLLWPDLMIISGGVTEEWDSFGHLLVSGTEILPARYRAQAGIVGAALAAVQHTQ